MPRNQTRNSCNDFVAVRTIKIPSKESKIGHKFSYISGLILEMLIELEDEVGALQKDEQGMLALSSLIAQKLRNNIREVVVAKPCNCSQQCIVELDIRFK